MTRRIPTLETERLLIRELTMDDLEVIHHILNDAFGGDAALQERERWLQWTVLGYEMFAELGQPHYGERGIALKETGELIGAIGIVPYIDDFIRIKAFNGRTDGQATAEVGLFWAVDPAYQGLGYATEAAQMMVYYLERYLKLGRIIATTGYGNQASQAVMRKIGMIVEHAARPQPPDIFVVGVLDQHNEWQSTFHALIRHPHEPKIYLRQWKTGRGLPRTRVGKYVWNAHTDTIAEAMAKQLHGEVWINRLIQYREEEDKKRIEGVYEIAFKGRLNGGAWVDRNQLAGLSLREEHLRPFLETTLLEMETGMVPAKRPVWSFPGDDWRNEVQAWVERELAKLGHRMTGLEQVKHWCLSSVLRVKTEGPDFYFKVPAELPLFVDEAVVTQRLAECFPRYVLRPVAIDPARGWMLFPDFGENFSWHTPLAGREEVVRRFAYLQRETVGMVEQLLADGITDRRLHVLEMQIDPLLNDPDALAELTAEQAGELRAYAPLLKELCRRLAAFKIPHTLVHGDLHVGNAARWNGEMVYFDWTDVCIAHPFFDLLSLHWEVDKFEREKVKNAYLEVWAGVESPAGLREAAAIADVLMPLHHAVSVQHIRMGIEPLAKAEIMAPAGFLREVLHHLMQHEAEHRSLIGPLQARAEGHD